MSEGENRRERVGALYLDEDVTDEDKSKLVFAIQRDSPFIAELRTDELIDVFKVGGGRD